VKWGPFYAPFPASVSYEIDPPSGANGEQCFGAGIVSVDGFNETVCGDSCMDYSCCPFAPADDLRPTCNGCADCSGGCQDGQVEMSEIIGYACAWKKGCNDDISGMTRSAYIWRAGECYCWDDAAHNWMAHACASPASGCCEGGGIVAAAEVTTALPVEVDVEVIGQDRVLSTNRSSSTRPIHDPVKRTYTVRAVPPPGTQASAVEVAVPKGWTISAIGDGGSWDDAHHKVKWGPFFGDAPLTLKFEAQSLRASGKSVGLTGVASYDGVNHRFSIR
jgi:hypothetical protein